jgi:hypothetical protein
LAWSRSLAAVAVLAAAPAGAQPAQKVTGPVATYWMSAQTQSGFGLPGAGGQPDRGAMMRMMMGGGGGAQHLLTLQLGSSRKASSEPQAEHLPPEGLGVGPSLPLVTPRSAPAAQESPAIPRDFQRPNGRMLIFWGCGERAGPNQPVVIDFAKLGAGQVPPGLKGLGGGFGVSVQPPSPARNATYGEWPNARARTSVPADGSLVGRHSVRGDYTPDIQFSLGAGQDFLDPLSLTSNDKTGSGAVQLGWNAVPAATGYFASVMGGDQNQVVFWTSSATQTAAFMGTDYLPPAEAARLVAAKTLLGPQVTSCTVPREVAEAAPHAIVQLVAYGPEANFVYPLRPSDPKVAWNKEWQVKVRYRSATGGMLGMEMPGLSEEDSPRRGGPPRGQPQGGGQERRGGFMRGLGGALGVPVPGF